LDDANHFAFAVLEPCGDYGGSYSAEWCAWQELNLLPFGPEPNALSGELQARAG
jgi:hypothetical protein